MSDRPGDARPASGTLTLRERLRRLRLYYRSRPLFRERLADPGIARRLPFVPGDRPLEIAFRSGRRFRMRAGQWPLLPTACRLDRLGAEFEFLPDAKRIVFDGLTFYSPLAVRSEADYLREVLVDDVYGAKARRFDGGTVVDVGAYIGDSALAFARQGATVHALEPSQAFCGFLRRNLAANDLAASVTVHPVGLAEQEREIAADGDRLRFVEGIGYALSRLPASVDLLKLDCEGAEYHLLGDARFLSHLSPVEIRMEYHRGLEPLVGPLEKSGYALHADRTAGPVGMLTARKRSAAP